MNAWTYLAIGIVCEVAATSSIRLSEGFTKPTPTLLCLLGFAIALYMVAKATETLEIGVVYAVWSGVGVALIAMMGMIFYDEALTTSKVFFMALIVTGAVGLQLTNSH